MTFFDLDSFSLQFFKMLRIILLPLVSADMIDYEGENRYYGETVRDILFRKPYRERLLTIILLEIAKKAL